MSENPSKFVWYDVMTSDTKSAASFYQDVIGWNVQETDMDYTIFSVGESMVGGLMPIPPNACEEGAKPTWSGYIYVDDVDSHAKKIVTAGGAIHREPSDIPGIGRFAVAADPTGAHFIIFHPNGTRPPGELDPNTPGLVGWHELHSGDLATTWAFYEGLFGWTKAGEHDMGPMGVYQLFGYGETVVGGMMTKCPDMPHAQWLYYFNVEAIDAAVGRVSAAGGKVLNDPMEVPTGQWVAQCADPQGAMFALVAPKR
jgi:predicted enzyme related to lactoylglutathione lyase